MEINVNGNEQTYIDSVFDEGRKKDYQSTGKVAFDAKNYLNTRLDPDEKSRVMTIRIILTKNIDGVYKVAIPVETHSVMLNEKQQKSGIISRTSKFKSFICLNDQYIDNTDERGCPFCNKKFELFNEANLVKDNPNEKKAICKQAYKFDSKTTYIVRCIERGKEDEGIKFWRFNKHDDGSGIYDTLLNIAKLYNSKGIKVFDYNTGYDLILTLSKDPAPKPGAPDKTTIQIQADIMPSPLAQTQEDMDRILNDTKDWRDMYRTKSYDYLKLVADGEVPVKDRNNPDKYVAWVDADEWKQKAKEQEQEAAQELKNDFAETKTVTENVDTYDNNDDQLPF